MNARDHTQDDGQLLRPDTVMLHPSPTNPRKTFAEASLQELAESIKQHGIMQPIVVREMPEAMRLQFGTEARLEIVAGERRWRAANIAGLPTVPVLLRDLTDEQVISLQIIEFQSTPVIANGRIPSSSRCFETSKSCFNPRPLLLTGESSRVLCALAPMVSFQSTPVIANGRIEIRTA